MAKFHFHLIHPNPTFQNERVRGTGGKPTSFGEENLLSLPLDRYDDGRVHRGTTGANGGPNQRRGASAAPLELPVPVGTTVWIAGETEGAPLADLERGRMIAEVMLAAGDEPDDVERQLMSVGVGPVAAVEAVAMLVRQAA